MRNYKYLQYFLLPLYKFDYYLNNDSITFEGIYSYCPNIVINNVLFIDYIVYDKTITDKLIFPNVIEKHYFFKDNCEHLLLIIQRPKEFIKDIENIIQQKFYDLTWNCKNKILSYKNNQLYKEFLTEQLFEFNNYKLPTKERIRYCNVLNI